MTTLPTLVSFLPHLSPACALKLMEALTYAATAATAVLWHRKVWVCYVTLSLLTLMLAAIEEGWLAAWVD
jgi:hypothetical protein